MIRKNYSLSSELKKQESRNQSRIRNRQKHQATIEKLKDIDPIQLYRKLERAKAGDTNKSKKYIETLESDWEFIKKHGLHKDRVDKFLSEQQAQEQERERLRTKLWGDKSVYFNPELNPLGKVPDVSKLSGGISGLGNHTLPLKPNLQKNYDPDPIIEQLQIKPPPGSPPKFYKKVYNTGRDHIATIQSTDDGDNKRQKTG